MNAETLLVVGIHREELHFGDHVAALVDPSQIAVLRIPTGIPQARTGNDDAFYSNTQHREIYLQLRQQVKGRYRLLIDLHCGLDQSGRSADVFCHQEQLLGFLGEHLPRNDSHPVRLIKIVGQSGPVGPDRNATVEAGARTWIPKKIWDDDNPLYVGLEIYLPAAGDGNASDWQFALRLIGVIHAFTHTQTHDTP